MKIAKVIILEPQLKVLFGITIIPLLFLHLAPPPPIAQMADIGFKVVLLERLNKNGNKNIFRILI